MADEKKTTYPHEVTIKIRAFPYYVDVEDPVTGRLMRQERVAERGDTVKLSDIDYERAQRFDAVQSEADVELQESVGAFSLDTASVEEVAEYIKSEKPSVDTLVEGVNEDPVKARKVIDAENLATGQQPRSSLVNKLEDIAAGA